MPVPPAQRQAAAARLISETVPDRQEAARRLVSSASRHGIDLSLMWAVFSHTARGAGQIPRQVCLATPGSGRTLLLFLSGPDPALPLGDPGEQTEERRLVLEAACLGAQARLGGALRLAQCLPEPSEHWAADALAAAGFMRIAELAYLHRDLAIPVPSDTPDGSDAWPAGVTVRPVHGAAPGEPDHDLLLAALERSYQNTLDCPELCGLRETSDVLASHRAAGVFDPSLWWLVLRRGEPHGCLLLNPGHDGHSVELVYVGLSPELRGSGLGRSLLFHGLRAARRRGARLMSCAVDRRNTPALRLYEFTGFEEVAARVAFVRRI